MTFLHDFNVIAQWHLTKILRQLFNFSDLIITNCNNEVKLYFSNNWPLTCFQRDDTLCYMYTIIWPPEDEHYCSKHVEEYYINKRNLCIKLVINT